MLRRAVCRRTDGPSHFSTTVLASSRHVGLDHRTTNSNDGVARHDLRLLLLDHYDSFTYNLVDLLAQLCTRPPRVVAADAATSYAELIEQVLREESSSDDELAYDGIVLGPGPGTPSDFPLSLDVLRNANVPVLGVCLGHQMMGLLHGAQVTLAPREIHGQVWSVRLQHSSESTSLFDGLPARIPATRYHSLQVTWKEATDPSHQRSVVPLRATAVTDDGVCMALQHDTLPHYGVQFHPESIGSQPHGRRLLENFCRIAVEHRRSRPRQQLQQAQERLQRRWSERTLVTSNTFNGDTPHNPESRIQNKVSMPQGSPQASHGNGRRLYPAPEESMPTTRTNFTVLMHSIPSSPATPEQVMQSFLAHERHSFWLDSSDYQPQHLRSLKDANNSNNRISILGTATARGGRRIEYYGDDYPESERGVYVHRPGTRGGETIVERLPIDIFTYLGQEHGATAFETIVVPDVDQPQSAPFREAGPHDEAFLQSLPFDFRGGYVGYLGYEVRFDTERFLQQEELGPSTKHGPGRFTKSSHGVPTAAFMWADRSFVYDHSMNHWYLVVVVPRESAEDRLNALVWMRESARRLRGSRLWTGTETEFPVPSHSPGPSPQKLLTFVPKRSRKTYNRNFRTCLEHIRAGDSYELCLTNRFEAGVNDLSKSPLTLYRILRRRNPAPFSAFFNWNSESTAVPNHGAQSSGYASFAIVCSSPERFVSVRRHRNPKSEVPSLQVEAKPIKGTAARVLPSDGRGRTPQEAALDARRAQELQDSVKDRAENLMIVDLLRNDLSRVCVPGSVHVAKLFGIESFATVHQMVSTIRGELDRNRSLTAAIDVLKACFPGGSMTGAPKKRTTEILAELEDHESRGPYSGCLGYISLDGSMDMNIVIRSAVLTRDENRNEWRVGIGAGGAITALSESDDEYREMMLKAATVMGSVTDWARSGGGAGAGAGAGCSAVAVDHPYPSNRHEPIIDWTLRKEFALNATSTLR